MTTATTTTKRIECQHCAGKGIVHSTEWFKRRYVDIWVDCPNCDGKGGADLEWCTACDNECVLPSGELCECALLPEEEPEAEQPPVTYRGGTVDAPGFTTETFERGVAKAVERGYLRMTSIGGGRVVVESATSAARYTVSRTHCECLGHLYTGHCYHRAAAIYANDVCGIDITQQEVLGFSETGQPVTRRARAAELAAA